MNIFSLKIGGEAGQGIKSAGLMIAKIATRSGYHIYTYTEYPSLIRGGHNVMQVCFSSDEVLAPGKTINFLIALNQETIDRHYSELLPGSGVLFDSEEDLDTTKVGEDINLYGVPLAKLAKEAGGSELLINTVALGALLALLGGSLEILLNLLSEEFGSKGEEIVSTNQKAAQSGFNFATQTFTSKIQKILEAQNTESKIIVNGNEAVSLGAIAGGMQFAAIYPMSPISNILHVLSANQEKYGYIYKQPEDEIAAVNMAIGASFAGARSLTATSGGGFCLMTEGYGLAGMTETPVVIINGQRPGPATGLATWSGQGDLQFVLHAAQGDFPKIVLAAGDSKETFEMSMQAFNLADKYQTPVVLLLDKNICENDQSFPPFDISSYQVDKGKFTTAKESDYKRYGLSDDGISKRAVPGSGNFFITNSYEHNEEGFETENVDDINAQMKKRMTKLKTCAEGDMPKPQLFGPKEADLTFVSWGSNKGSILQAIAHFPNVNFLHITWMSPFPTDDVRNILAQAKYIVDVECNFTGQLANLIREKTGIEIMDKMLKFDGRPIFPEEIVDKIKSIIKI